MHRPASPLVALALLALAGFALFAFGSAPAHAQTGGIVDRFDPSARGVAMGESGVTTPEGPFAVYWNVAGLAVDQQSGVGVSYSPVAPGIRENAWILHGALDARFGAFGIGAQFAHLDAGRPESARTADPYGDSGETETQSAVRLGGAVDVLGLLGVEPREDRPDFSVGVLAERIAVDRGAGEVTQDLGSGAPGGEASSWTMGLGAFARWGRFVTADSSAPARRSWLGLRGGFAYDCVLENDLEFEERPRMEALPSRIRVGIAGEARLLPTDSGRTRLHALLAYERLDDVTPGAGSVVHGVGGELEFLHRFALRAGYVSGEDDGLEGETFGAGVQALPGGGRFQLWLDYASRPQAGDLDRVHVFTASLRVAASD